MVYLQKYKKRFKFAHKTLEWPWWLWGQWAADSRREVRRQRRCDHQVWVWL